MPVAVDVPVADHLVDLLVRALLVRGRQEVLEVVEGYQLVLVDVHRLEGLLEVLLHLCRVQLAGSEWFTCRSRP